jgi:hypothetical protein
MEYEEAKELIVTSLTKKLKMKSKFYFNDLAKILEMKPRVAKKKSSTNWFRTGYWSTGLRAAPPCTACPAPASSPELSTKINSGLRRQNRFLVNRRLEIAFETGSIQPAVHRNTWHCGCRPSRRIGKNHFLRRHYRRAEEPGQNGCTF